LAWRQRLLISIWCVCQGHFIFLLEQPLGICTIRALQIICIIQLQRVAKAAAFALLA
jgi:hypothetical protein